MKVGDVLRQLLDDGWFLVQLVEAADSTNTYPKLAESLFQANQATIWLLEP